MAPFYGPQQGTVSVSPLRFPPRHPPEGFFCPFRVEFKSAPKRFLRTFFPRRELLVFPRTDTLPPRMVMPFPRWRKPRSGFSLFPEQLFIRKRRRVLFVPPFFPPPMFSLTPGSTRAVVFSFRNHSRSEENPRFFSFALVSSVLGPTQGITRDGFFFKAWNIVGSTPTFLSSRFRTRDCSARLAPATEASFRDLRAPFPSFFGSGFWVCPLFLGQVHISIVDGSIPPPFLFFASETAWRQFFSFFQTRIFSPGRNRDFGASPFFFSLVFTIEFYRADGITEYFFFFSLQRPFTTPPLGIRRTTTERTFFFGEFIGDLRTSIRSRSPFPSDFSLPSGGRSQLFFFFSPEGRQTDGPWSFFSISPVFFF